MRQVDNNIKLLAYLFDQLYCLFDLHSSIILDVIMNSFNYRNLLVILLYSNHNLRQQAKRLSQECHDMGFLFWKLNVIFRQKWS
jgi:hypothetical protein